MKLFLSFNGDKSHDLEQSAGAGEVPQRHPVSSFVTRHRCNDLLLSGSPPDPQTSVGLHPRAYSELRQTDGEPFVFATKHRERF